MDYLVIIEHGEDGSCGAYVPDLPGVIAAGDSEEEVIELMREAIPFHIQGLVEDGDSVPQPSSTVATVHVEEAAA